MPVRGGGGGHSSGGGHHSSGSSHHSSSSHNSSYGHRHGSTTYSSTTINGVTYGSHRRGGFRSIFFIYPDNNTYGGNYQGNGYNQGVAQQTVPATGFCPACSTTYKYGQKFCESCGSPLPALPKSTVVVNNGNGNTYNGGGYDSSYGGRRRINWGGIIIFLFIVAVLSMILFGVIIPAIVNAFKPIVTYDSTRNMNKAELFDFKIVSVEESDYTEGLTSDLKYVYVELYALNILTDDLYFSYDEFKLSYDGSYLNSVNAVTDNLTIAKVSKGEYSKFFTYSNYQGYSSFKLPSHTGLRKKLLYLINTDYTELVLRYNDYFESSGSLRCEYRFTIGRNGVLTSTTDETYLIIGQISSIIFKEDEYSLIYI